MKLAAAKLGVTPGAVSQQVKIVEERLGALLFERSSREIQLTEEGLRLMEGLNLPFSHIDEVVRDFRRRKPRSDTLVVTTVPSFASSWLVPRIGSFSEAFPHIEVRVDISVSLVDLRHEPVDVAIRHGSGNYPGMTVTQLFTPKLIVVASPRLLARFPPIKSPADCLGLPLLQDRNRADWTKWLRAHNVEDQDGRGVRGTSFPDDALMIKAACSAQGLAIVRDIYAEDALSSGLVQIAIDASIGTSFSYYFVSKPEALQNPRVRAFRTWLLGEIANRPPSATTE